jgi:PBP1b-binding outer membrane lipoprotein LpoB
MNKIALVLFISLFLTGCATAPMQTFSPFTTSGGQQKWRMVVKGFDEAAIQSLIEANIGKSHICPNGWVILKREPTGKFEIIEGECK